MSVLNPIAFLAPGGPELVIIMLVLIMLFGAKDAPRVLRKIQDFFDHVRRIANSFRHEMMYSDLHEDRAGSAEDHTLPEDYEDAEFLEYEDGEEGWNPEPGPESPEPEGGAPEDTGHGSGSEPEPDGRDRAPSTPPESSDTPPPAGPHDEKD
ncbi:hypothetical protein [Kiritimatiella glycovorans]|uniref:Sec-independent translocase n=1 Tax=Kiritimatiella glycovorans TaxID=1307763 RepID=A0A0G3EHT6_9BACT|nr:hypothetical protein [Kiritimatiella glycovorans]AKJ64987.1 sec-independent translocase [Kiritimatiella glycovorans]